MFDCCKASYFAALQANSNLSFVWRNLRDKKGAMIFWFKSLQLC